MNEESGVATVELDLGRIADVRSRVPALRHRQTIGEVVAR